MSARRIFCRAVRVRSGCIWRSRAAGCAPPIAFTLDGEEWLFSGGLGCWTDKDRNAPQRPLPPFLAALLRWANVNFKSAYNGILINQYEGGGDSLGQHSDDERLLDQNAGVI